MSNAQTLKITPERAREMPMVDLAFLILKAANTPYYYRDLMQEVAKTKGIAEDEMMDLIAQLYTEINIDGRFACVGNNLWGLKRWYPLDKAEDALGNATRPRIINDDDDDEDDDLYTDEEAEEDTDFVEVDGDDYDSENEEELDDEVDDEVDEELDDEELDEDLDEESEEEFDGDESEEDNYN